MANPVVRIAKRVYVLERKSSRHAGFNLQFIQDLSLTNIVATGNGNDGITIETVLGDLSLDTVDAGDSINGAISGGVAHPARKSKKRAYGRISVLVYGRMTVLANRVIWQNNLDR